MRAAARVTAADRGGVTRYPVLRSEPPLLLRPTLWGLLLVGGAAGPLGGDDLSLELTVEAGARVVIGSVAAAVLLPGRRGGGGPPSRLVIDATVAAGAELVWDPEPTISTAASSHHQLVEIALGEGARLRWREATVFGRDGEPPGSFRSSLRVERQGRVIHHGELDVDRVSWASQAVLGGARSLVTELTVGDPSPPPADPGPPPGAGPTVDARVRSSLVELGPDVRLGTAIGSDPARCRAVLRCGSPVPV